MNISTRMLRRQIIMKLFLVVGKFFHRNNTPKTTDDILIIKLDEIGDIILLSPFLRELRRIYPDNKITMVVKPACKNLLDKCPYIDELLDFKVSKGNFFSSILSCRRFAKAFLQGKFGMAIIPRWEEDTIYYATFLAYFSGAARRIAYSEKAYPEKATRNKGYDQFVTDPIFDTTYQHSVNKNLKIIEYLGYKPQSSSLEVWTTEDDNILVKHLFQEAGIDIHSKKKKIALFLSSGAKKKEWSITNYIQLINELQHEYDVEFLLFGDMKNTANYANEVCTACTHGVFDFVGSTSLRQTIAALRLCDIYLGGDTGPMHMAAACEMKGVVLFCHPTTGDRGHANSPYRFGPWNNSRMKVLQPMPLAGCEHGCDKDYGHCINNISVKEVYSSIKELLGS